MEKELVARATCSSRSEVPLMGLEAVEGVVVFLFLLLCFFGFKCVFFVFLNVFFVFDIFMFWLFCVFLFLMCLFCF